MNKKRFIKLIETFKLFGQFVSSPKFLTHLYTQTLSPFLRSDFHI